MFNRIGSTQAQPCVLPDLKKKEITIKSIIDLDKGGTNVAGSIEINEKDKHRYLLKSNPLPKSTIITISRWLIGVVAMHQSCKNCSGNVELSRSHAVHCSGALSYISTFYTIPLYNRNSPFDYLLNLHRHSEQGQFYEHLENAIKLIYEKCLNYEMSENGFWIPRRIRDNALDDVG